MIAAIVPPSLLTHRTRIPVPVPRNRTLAQAARALAFVTLLLCRRSVFAADVPQAISYQGRVAVGGIGFNGVGQFKFALVSQDGAATFWSNDGTSVAGAEPTNAVPLGVANGLFTVLLGETSYTNMMPIAPSVFAASAVRLRTWFNDGTNGFQQLAPDQRIVSVGYAMVAATVPGSGITGTISDARLSSNVPLLSATNRFPGVAFLTNAGNVVNGTFTGDLVGNVAGSVSGSASGFTGGLAGDVTGTQGATVVSKVGGQSAANVASAASAVGAATSTATANTVVRRDASGSFAGGTINAASFVGSGAGITNISTANLTGLIASSQIAPSAVGPTQLAPGAASANLLAAGESGVASSGIVLSLSANAPTLANAGFIKIPGASLSVGDAWTSLATTTPPAPRWGHSAIWTGTELIIWGGWNQSTTTFYNDGWRYNPVTGAWTPVSTNSAPSLRTLHSAIWTGTNMLVFGGWDGAQDLGDLWSYNPASDTWTQIATTNAPTARCGHTAIWTGTAMIVWGGDEGNGGSFYGGTTVNDGWSYNPATGNWSPIATAGAPSGRNFHTAVWTGTNMIIWGGYATFGSVGSVSRLADGGLYDPVADSWSMLSQANPPNAHSRQCAVWTGAKMLIFGGTEAPGGFVGNDGWSFDVGSGTWTQIANGPPAHAGAAAVWTGGQMLMWGGEGASSTFNDMWAYNPLASLYLYLKP